MRRICSSCCKVISTKKKLNNHILENYVVPPEAPDHLPIATLPCLTAQCNHSGKNFSRKSSLSKHMLVVHAAGRPSKILQDRYVAKLMARRRISFSICYINLKTRLSFKENMKSGAHFMEPSPGLWGNSYFCLIGPVLVIRTHFLQVI